MLVRVHDTAMTRKRVVYWIGFLEGALASRAIEPGEDGAILAEARRFQEFFEDPDASDLVEDLAGCCFADSADLMDQLRVVIDAKRAILAEGGPYQDVDEFNEFLGFCAGVVCDGRLLDREVRAMMERFRRSAALMKSPMFLPLRQAIFAAMHDDVLSLREAGEIEEWIVQLVGDGYADTGVESIGQVATPDEPIRDPALLKVKGANFVLTGPMSMGPRRYISSRIVEAGGFVFAAPSRKTDYLIVSRTASRFWKTTHFGTKIERCRAMIAEGYQMRFACETALAKALDGVARPM